MDLPSNLTRGQVRIVSRILRGHGAMLPKIGMCWCLGPLSRKDLRAAGFMDYRGEAPSTLYHDGHGYFWGWM
jgi:hypothetical protein